MMIFNYTILFSSVTMSMSQLSVSKDWEMSDISYLPLMCDSDVIGSGATSNNNTVDIDVDIPLVCEAMPCVSSSLTQDINTPAIALSGLFSMMEYVKTGWLVRQNRAAETVQMGMGREAEQWK